VMSLMCSKSRAACRLTEVVFALAVSHVSDHSFVDFFGAPPKLRDPLPRGQPSARRSNAL